MLDLTIRLGDILTVIVIGCGGLLFLYTMRADLRILSSRVQNVEGKLGLITEILVKQAGHDARLDTVERDIREIKTNYAI